MRARSPLGPAYPSHLRPVSCWRGVLAWLYAPRTRRGAVTCCSCRAACRRPGRPSDEGESLNALLSNPRAGARLLPARRRVHIRCDESALETIPHDNGSLHIGDMP